MPSLVLGGSPAHRPLSDLFSAIHWAGVFFRYPDVGLVTRVRLYHRRDNGVSGLCLLAFFPFFWPPLEACSGCRKLPWTASFLNAGR